MTENASPDAGSDGQRPDQRPPGSATQVRYNVPRTRPVYDDPEDEELDDFLYPETGDGYEYVNTVQKRHAF